MRDLTTSAVPLPGQGGGTLVTVGHQHGLSVRSAWGGAGRVVLAVNVHGPYGGYATTYLTVTPVGVTEVLQEELGVNPSLFSGPDGAPWARLSLVTEGRDHEPDTLVPLHGREAWGDPVRTTEFAGDFVGWIGRRAFWHLDDVFDDRRPARIQPVDVDADRRIRVRRPVRLPLPQSHEAVLCTEGRHLATLGWEQGPAAVLRILTPELTVEREVPVQAPGDPAFLQPVRVHADGRATLLSVDATGRVALVPLDGRGDRQAVTVGELPAEPFAVWPVTPLGPDRFAFRFTTEDGNGLMLIEGQAVEVLWTSAPDGYRRHLGDEQQHLVPLGTGWDQPILTAAVPTGGGGYALVLHPQGDARSLAVLFAT